MVAPITPQNVQSPQSVTRKRRLADAMMQQGTDTSPVGHPLGALARAMQGGMAGYMSRKADTAESEGRAGAMSRLTEAMANKNMGTADYMTIASDPWMPEGASPLVGAMFKSHLDSQAPADWQKLDDNTLFNRLGETKELAGGVPEVDFNDQLQLTGQALKGQGVQRFQEVEPLIHSMRESIDDNRTAMDMDFIYGASLSLSPDGRVTDQDAQNLSGNASMRQRIRGEIDAMLRGEGKLTPTSRRALYDLAVRRAGAYRKQAEGELQQYGRIAPQGYQLPELGAMPEALPPLQPEMPEGAPQQPGTAPMQGTMAPDPEGWIMLQDGRRIRQVR
jgi:hypothetical protein